jgi:hypothetical protein
VVEPVHPFQRGEFHGFRIAPGATPMDDLGLEEAVDGFGKGVLIKLSPTLPTEGSISASDRRSGYRIETYSIITRR